MTKLQQKKAVLVTTVHRGVFFGYTKDDSQKTIVLTGARCAIRWNTTGGFLELAEKGPNSGSKIGSLAPLITLHDVTSCTDVTPAAVEAWEKA